MYWIEHQADLSTHPLSIRSRFGHSDDSDIPTSDIVSG
jgi:hypothetical protein